MKRIQRKRTKGFKLPENTVCINRPTKWGNPFKLMGDMIYIDAGHRRKVFSKWVCFYDNGGHTIEEVVQLFSDMIIDTRLHYVEPEIKERFKVMQESISELKGKHLACFCKEGKICHGDILLELANEK